MRLILAPMEGVLDHTLRDILTRVGGYERCVTEFVRVTDRPLPPRVFYRACPELLTGGATPAGMPVFLQLLGGDPAVMAANAHVAQQLGAPGIDLNFGCPSKTVNRSDGGSALLREPERVCAIVSAVRAAVDPQVPVTAKIRLGFHDGSLFEDIALGIQQAGADELCVHARTRQQGYQPPAYWSEIGKVKPKLHIPVIANGDIWSPGAALQAQADSGCADLMLGRGALAFPDLALAIKAQQGGASYQPMPWPEILPLVVRYADTLTGHAPKYAASFIKQWFTYLRRQYPEAESLFQHIKRLKLPMEIKEAIILPPCGFTKDSPP
ncbi:tRNA-dihydrouridine synthase [Candidatus Thiothrix sp. Deng01]|uniref:tRNA-dihydrouridine(16) synthase n=1 Tax=Candidatus Thiothrix phosphatis TaxID=3112415 RepID=A0ABU6D482_9GAMM|nr:tRNA-dihydrouridine synthase [Candidatus Thiothrix sp. Deng01]MEB4593483.1 tRNA-dihydrouridine synthase [Candidatus Thiothrix sp. Deng01]